MTTKSWKRECRVTGLLFSMCLFAALSPNTPAGAQNLLADADFSAGNLDAWFLQQGGVSWSSFTASGSSGSALFEDADPGPQILADCQPALPEADYFVHGSTFLPVQGGNYGAQMTVSFYDQPGCVINIGQNDSPTAVEGSWVVVSNTISSPVGTESVSYQIWMLNNTGEQRQLYWDDVFLALGLFVDGFEGGSTAVWSSAVSGSSD